MNKLIQNALIAWTKTNDTIYPCNQVVQMHLLVISRMFFFLFYIRQEWVSKVFCKLWVCK